MSKCMERLCWITRQVMEPRRIACILLSGVILCDLQAYLGDKGWMVLTILYLSTLFIVFYVTSYGRDGKWYDWQAATSASEDEWKYIREVLILTTDPLVHPKPPCFSAILWKDRLGGSVFAIAVLVFAIYSAYRFFGDGQSIVGWLRYRLLKLSVVTNGYGPVLMALIGAAAAVMTIFMTVRQNTRSTNRQAWINSIRKLMASLIAGVPSNDAELVSAQNIYWPQYVELALYLNPSEKAHRAFLYAIAAMYGAGDYWLWGGCPCNSGLECFGRHGEHVVHRVQGLTRLSNVVLKIEWEQVKKLA